MACFFSTDNTKKTGTIGITQWGRQKLNTMCPWIIQSMIARGWPINVNNRRLRALANCHRGRVGFLIGNGPSVRAEDLERLQGQPTFCCNRFHLAYHTTSFRPAYTLSADDQMIGDFGEEILAKSAGQVILISNTWREYYRSCIWCRYEHGPSRFSTNPYSHVFLGGATSGAAIQLGYHMGIQRFLLYGVDHSFTMTVDPVPRTTFAVLTEMAIILSLTIDLGTPGAPRPRR